MAIHSNEVRRAVPAVYSAMCALCRFLVRGADVFFLIRQLASSDAVASEELAISAKTI